VTYEKKSEKNNSKKSDWYDEHHKTYWLVMLKTKRCYDFAGHLSLIIAWDEDIMPKMRKIHEGLGKRVVFLSIFIGSQNY
jgi:L-2-hydroxyglutarate oxidase LhgO